MAAPELDWRERMDRKGAFVLSEVTVSWFTAHGLAAVLLLSL